MPEMIRETEERRDDGNRALCPLADYGPLEFKGAKLESLSPTVGPRTFLRLAKVAADGAIFA
jgi:hypothetical protein